MKLIKSSVQILDQINESEVINKIASVARTCYKSEDNSTPEKDKALVKRLIESGHEAMIEHYSISVKFICDRGVSHEIVRHRIAAYAQESTRYCNYTKDKFDNEITYIIPSQWIDEIPEGKCSWADGDWMCDNGKSLSLFREDEDKSIDAFLHAIHTDETYYNILINDGLTPQQARAVLPNCLKTELNVTANLREWRHFFKLRCSTAAHPDMRVLALDLLKQMYELVPTVFEDIYDTYFGNKE